MGGSPRGGSRGTHHPILVVPPHLFDHTDGCARRWCGGLGSQDVGAVDHNTHHHHLVVCLLLGDFLSHVSENKDFLVKKRSGHRGKTPNKRKNWGKKGLKSLTIFTIKYPNPLHI
jgi:hypothetical protein